MRLKESRTALALILFLLGGVTLALLWVGGGPASPLRHFYLVPVLWGALRFGRLGGVVTGLLAVLLYAPFVLPEIEREEVAAETVEGLVTLGLLLVVGALAGALAGRARTQASRYQTLLTLRRALENEAELPALLAAAAENLQVSLGAKEVVLLIVSPGSEPLVVSSARSPVEASSAAGYRQDSAAGWVLATGTSLFVADLNTDPRFDLPRPIALRSRRLFLVPLRARDGLIGVMTVERHGEFPGEDQEEVETLGLQLALGIENARLAISQRRFAEELKEKVAKATVELRELDKAKSDFVSIVSHEMRTPLTSIQGFSEILLTRTLPQERIRRFLTFIHQEAERLGRIVRDLLDLSRIELGRKLEVRRVPLDLRPLIERNVELFQGQTARHQILWDAPRDLPPALADPDAMDQVVKNLLSNAVKYSPGGGAIRVWAVPSAPEPETVELGVEDHGVGIPPPALPRIFEKYYRVTHPATAHERGLGIGLALVKALVEAQGGSIRVESREGEGSRFVVLLPAAMRESAQPPASGHAQRADC